MKALFIKDWKLLKNQGKMFGAVLVFYGSLAVVVVLPTPPFPDVITITSLILRPPILYRSIRIRSS